MSQAQPIILDDGVELAVSEDDAKYLTQARMIFLCGECEDDGCEGIYHPTLDNTYLTCEQALKDRA